ncbi:cation:proton antiporter [Pseudonocardia sp.]|uniref:cation:proton antiporter n=1 Tax=Pseudonocardia sp. TaxID=60912 RepID=UPI003D0B2C57
MSLKEIIPYVLLDVAIVVAAARIMGQLFRRIGQPAVIGEIVAGIALGPTLLGALPGNLDTLLFPPDVRPYLSVIAQLGLALFMFIVGLEVDLSLIRGRGRAAGAIAGGSIALPFALGIGTAVLVYPWHSEVDGRPVPMLAFVLFLAVALSITALPVLARILTERGMQRTPIGVLALACAAIDDVLGWSLLAVVVAVAAGGDMAGVARILGLTLAFALVAFLVVRPLLARLVGWYDREGRLTPDMLAVILVGLFLSAWLTEIIGVHAIFGAFVFGAIMPRRGAAGLTRAILERLEQVSLLLLLPVFFVVAGLQVDVGSIGADGIWQLGLILVVAIVGKVIGGGVAARTQGMPRRSSTAIGLLMNTRGLTEIVILQVGVQLGLLGPAMFTIMVLMALVTTMMTGPLLKIVYPDRVLQRELDAADRAELGDVDAYTVLVSVPEGPHARAMAELGRRMAGAERPVRIVLARLLPAQVQLEVASGLGAELAMMAAAGDELRRLARELEASGDVHCSVVARFAPDPLAGLAELARTVDADVVVAPEVPAEEGAPGTVFSAALVLVRPGADADLDVVGEISDVTVLLDGGAGGRGALRLAAQAALARRGVLTVGATEGRRAARQAAAAVEALRRRGIDVRATGDLPASGLLVVPADALRTEAPETLGVLRVRPDEADLDEELEQSVERIALPAAAGSQEPVPPAP